MGQWNWNLSHVPSLATLRHAAGTFLSWIPSLHAHNTASVTRKSSAPCRSNAKKIRVSLSTELYDNWKSVTQFSLKPLVGNFGCFSHGYVESDIRHTHVLRISHSVEIPWNGSGAVTSFHGMTHKKSVPWTSLWITLALFSGKSWKKALKYFQLFVQSVESNHTHWGWAQFLML